jgi:hypothetical protein
MEPSDEQQIILEIINQAQSGKSTKFHFIATIEEYLGYCQHITSTKVVIKVLKRAADKLFKSYCKNVIKGHTPVDEILAVAEIREITGFYQKELTTFTEMVDEYRDYLCAGNFFRALMGEHRDI